MFSVALDPSLSPPRPCTLPYSTLFPGCLIHSESPLWLPCFWRNERGWEARGSGIASLLLPFWITVGWLFPTAPHRRAFSYSLLLNHFLPIPFRLRWQWLPTVRNPRLLYYFLPLNSAHTFIYSSFVKLSLNYQHYLFASRSLTDATLSSSCLLVIFLRPSRWWLWLRGILPGAWIFTLGLVGRAK